MDSVNSCMRDTDKFQENWATTKFNDFTVLKVINGWIIKKYRPVYIQFWCQQEIPTAKIVSTKHFLLSTFALGIK